MGGEFQPKVQSGTPEPGSFYYNVPAHIFLTSPFFSGTTLHASLGDDDRDTTERDAQRKAQLKAWADAREAKKRIREEESKKRREINAEYRRLASIAAKAKAIAEGWTGQPKPQAKHEVMLDTTPGPGNIGWFKALPPVPRKQAYNQEQRKRETIRERERRARIRQAVIDALPEGYVLAESVVVVKSKNAVDLALRKHWVAGAKIGNKWYCNARELQEYCIEAERKRLAGLAESRIKILEMRKAKAHDKGKVSTAKGDSV